LIKDTCDTCGAPAASAAADTVNEMRPDLGDRWEHHYPVGTVRVGCAAHPVEPVTYAPWAVPPDAPWWRDRDPAARERALSPLVGGWRFSGGHWYFPPGVPPDLSV
jgi:hypothetical protein